jgi:hypothetical protein
MAIQIKDGEFAMMGQGSSFQPKLFYHQINLEQRVPKSHILRKTQEQIDFDFIYDEVKESYGGNGNVSIPPPVILKMMLLWVLYNARSERELLETIPYMSTTDLDGAIVNRGKAKLSYQVHRAVDGKSKIITVAETTAGDVNEGHLLIPLLESHHANTGRKAETVVGDSKYGTVENFLACSEAGVEAHLLDLGKFSKKRTEERKIFTEEQFKYDPGRDGYRCPGGNLLRPKSLHKQRQSRDYTAPKKGVAPLVSGMKGVFREALISPPALIALMTTGKSIECN